MKALTGTVSLPTIVGIALIYALPTPLCAQNVTVKQLDSIVVATFSSKPENFGSKINFETANAFPLPMASHPSIRQSGESMGAAPLDRALLLSGKVDGRMGDQVIEPKQILPPQDPQKLNAIRSDSLQYGPEPQEFGTSGQVFTTSRIDPGHVTQAARFYPFSAAGKLFFNEGSSSFICSGALIRPGIVVTAAHCVANWGKSQFYTNFEFVPGYYNGNAPFQVWTASQVVIAYSYYIGDPAYCTSGSPGVVCKNDIALIKLNPKYPYGVAAWAGDFAGWLGYSWNGYGYNSEYRALISELGYPASLDNGVLMQRTDSEGYVDFGMMINTIIGSLQTGGSSGGPWVLNLGIPPVLSGTNFGYGSGHNYVAAVTSWGYTNSELKQQGASSFTSGNFLSLMNYVCPADIDECHP